MNADQEYTVIIGRKPTKSKVTRKESDVNGASVSPISAHHSTAMQEAGAFDDSSPIHLSVVSTSSIQYQALNYNHAQPWLGSRRTSARSLVGRLALRLVSVQGLGGFHCLIFHPTKARRIGAVVGTFRTSTGGTNKAHPGTRTSCRCPL